MHNLTEYIDICSKTSERLWQYYRDEPALNNAGRIIDFPADNDRSISFKIKEKNNRLNWRFGTKTLK